MTIEARPAVRILPSVQMLRGLAALAVAFHHIAYQAGMFVGRPGDLAYPWLQPLPWEAGVDVFFVISGFVILWSSRDLFGQPGAVRVFVGRRIARVVPLYWAATGLMLAVALVAPGDVNGPRPSLLVVATSLLFLPWPRADGLVRPLLILGWTLNYEMLFYALFACVVPLRARLALPCLIGAIGGLAVLGWAVAPKAAALAFWTDPIILEFALGVLLGVAAPHVRLALIARAALVAAGLAGLRLAAAVPELPHGLVFGPPCLALVAGVVLGEPYRVRTWLGQAAVGLGDLSYALYLLHPFPMRALALLWPRSAAMPSVLGYLTGATAASVALAWVTHRFVERPLVRAARRALVWHPAIGESHSAPFM